MDLKDRLAQLQSQRGRAAGTPAADPEPAGLHERLQRLRVASADCNANRVIDDHRVAERLHGLVIAPGLIKIEQRLSLADIPSLQFTTGTGERLGILADSGPLAGSDLLFLDTETTGLAGGTGTLAFLLGMARLDEQHLHLCQWFLTGFKAEAALLGEANAWLRNSRCLVSFNGKSFDVPLLGTRFRLARLSTALTEPLHLDLLHPLRRAFARHWPDCRLQTAEQRLLRLQRSGDLPGHLVPEVWSQFVRTGIFTQIPSLLQHNRQDLISLAALIGPLLAAYFEPGTAGIDRLAVARYLQQRDLHALALQHLLSDPGSLDPEGWLELANLHRRDQAWPEALSIWQRLAAAGHLVAMERLAKYHEHRQRDYHAALHWTEHLLARQGQNKAHHLRKSRLLARIDKH